MIKQTLKPLEVTLRSYGGGGLDIVTQLSATIQSGPYRKTAVVLGQNRALEDLLLGNDLQPHLRFQLLQKSGERPPTTARSRNQDEGQQQPPVVRLLQVVHLPAHYMRTLSKLELKPFGHHLHIYMHRASISA